MNALALMVGMFCIFFVVAYGAHAYVQHLRRRGHGARIDALHDATVRVQGRFRRSASGFLRSPRSGGVPPSAAPPPVDPFDTKRD